MHTFFLRASIILLSSGVCLNAETACNEKIIESLRVRYSFTGSDSLAVITKRLMCESSNTGVGVSYAGVGLDYKNAKNACEQNDLSYFEKHAQSIALSYVPPGALSTIKSICGNDNRLSLEIKPAGMTFTLFASYIPVQGGPQFAQVNQVNFSAADVSCDLKALQKNPQIGSGGRPISCKRLTENPSIISIDTNRGGQSVALANLKVAQWKLRAWGADDHLSCKLKHEDGSETALLDMGMGACYQGCPPTSIVPLTGMLKPGNNSVICQARNDALPSAWYHYDITKDDVIQSSFSDLNSNIGNGQLPQPQAFPIHVPTLFELDGIKAFALKTVVTSK